MKISTIDKNEFLFAFEQSLKDAIGYDDNVIDEGMRYAALDGGKRVRPLCVYYGARSCVNFTSVLAGWTFTSTAAQLSSTYSTHAGKRPTSSVLR